MTCVRVSEYLLPVRRTAEEFSLMLCLVSSRDEPKRFGMDASRAVVCKTEGKDLLRPRQVRG